MTFVSEDEKATQDRHHGISVDVALKLGNFDLNVAFENDAGITALFGRSGSGKSTTINLMAGLVRPDRGRIVLDGRTLVDTDAGLYVPKYRRRVGFVFQDSQLFPHLSVRQNLLFGRWFAPHAERSIALEPVVETLGISRLLARKPALLSGGEKQRVALGRALLASPKILLMDEPLASLDQERRLEILPLIERLRDEFRVPIVYVSHSVEEVGRLASLVVMLESGRVVAIGRVEDVLGPGLSAAGISRFARSSVITGRLAGIDEAYGLTEIAHPAGTIWLVGRAGPVGREARVVIKSTDITIAKTIAKTGPEAMSVRTTLSGRVTDIDRDDGPIAGVSIALDSEGRLYALATRKAVDELGLAAGERVFALIKTVALDERAVAPPGL
jgi:molybdate transport system ATP-binding protein